MKNGSVHHVKVKFTGLTIDVVNVIKTFQLIAKIFHNE